MADQTFHRPGPLKHTNKRHKTGAHRSKGAVANAMKGKINIKNATRKQKLEMRREQRRNQINQIRKNKRREAMSIKRQLGGQYAAPFLTCLLPLHSQIDPKSALAVLEYCDNDAIVDRSLSGVTYISLPRFKQRFAFITPPCGRGNEVEVLDYLKVCDTTLLLASADMGEDEVLDKWGHRIFNMISAQGIPTPIFALMDLECLNPKRRPAAKIAVQKFVSKLLPDEKIVQLGTNAEGLNIMRRIGGQKRNTMHNKSNRPHMFGDLVEFVPNTNNLGNFDSAQADADAGTLKVSGFLRGQPLDVNGLVHIPGLGDFQMHQIDDGRDPYKFDKSRDVVMAGRDSDQIRILAKAEPLKQTPLQKENIPDAMDAEQTWPTEEEIKASQQENKKMKLIKRVPKGWSDYQAAWIPDVEAIEEDGDGGESDSVDNIADGSDDDEDFMSCENESFDGDQRNNEGDSDDEYVDTASVSDAGAIDDLKYDQQMDFQEERETLKKIKEARIDEMWPDEIDTPLDVPARERFQKFRGLESFRSSPWDPKENLPSDYARIYQFKNFDRTKRRIIEEAKDIEGVLPGWYITIHIANVPIDRWASYKSARLTPNVIVYGMLQYEHQMSVMNVLLKRLPDSEVPIKSKEKLIIQCGYRRFVVNPIFSEHTNGNKHKFERYFRPQTTVCATFFAPIQFPPAAVMAFKENPDTTLALVARGCLLSCNPNRIVVKRVVLSGHPMRINRKSATIRYMFFNKEDVDYFAPVKLRTKCGRLGHIKESLGTHGHMKCTFDGKLRSYDTAFMYLYKRVFPKWTYDECLISCEKKPEKPRTESSSNSNSVVTAMVE